MSTMDEATRQEFLAGVHVGVMGIADGERGPLTVPVWYGYEPGGVVTVLTGPESRKAKLLEATGRFSLCAQQEELPYKYVMAEGPVVETRAATHDDCSGDSQRRDVIMSDCDMVEEVRAGNVMICLILRLIHYILYLVVHEVCLLIIS